MLKEKIDKILRANLIGIRGEVSQKGIDEVLTELRMDHAVSMVPDEEYDAVLIAVNNHGVELGYQYMGTVFNDKKNRFKDAEFITIGTVKNIVEPIEGLKLVSTKRSTYLVI
ncbi:Hypothetical protein KNT65_gp212 [Escherichia phage EcS1]|uniref:Uncharacterized protein n=1 Tax=Escherichia phage EcS1 TaxID=2083276 RepID=A0A2Z5ZD10_9CAUD|nr:Hypothetical protein KNT65_gp212 [Escherichia phage EcS1]BBC78281.1 Hypothetical protein [Escherichia phage EcS1]